MWGSGGIVPPFLTLALDGGEWSASRPCRFIPREIVPRTQWVDYYKHLVGIGEIGLKNKKVLFQNTGLHLLMNISVVHLFTD
jgi:hypothetical protein